MRLIYSFKVDVVLMAESWIKTFGQAHILKLKCCKQHNTRACILQLIFVTLNLFGTVTVQLCSYICASDLSNYAYNDRQIYT